MLMKHQEHQCKECKESSPTFMELLRHISQYHCKDQGGVQEGQYEEGGISKKEGHEEEREDDKNPTFVFEESMLDEFLEKKK